MSSARRSFLLSPQTRSSRQAIKWALNWFPEPQKKMAPLHLFTCVSMLSCFHRGTVGRINSNSLPLTALLKAGLTSHYSPQSTYALRTLRIPL